MNGIKASNVNLRSNLLNDDILTQEQGSQHHKQSYIMMEVHEQEEDSKMPNIIKSSKVTPFDPQAKDSASDMENSRDGSTLALIKNAGKKYADNKVMKKSKSEIAVKQFEVATLKNTLASQITENVVKQHLVKK
jgi:hypothetical protein